VKKIPKQEYTAEFEEQAVKHAQSVGIVVASKDLGLVEQTLRNWVKALAAGKLRAPGAKPVTPEQMELSWLRAENARLKMHADILTKRRRTLRKMRCEVRLDRRAAPRVPPARHVGGTGRERQRLSCLAPRRQT
jgi:transposase